MYFVSRVGTSSDVAEARSKKQKKVQSVTLKDELSCLGLDGYAAITAVTSIPKDYIYTSSYHCIAEMTNELALHDPKGVGKSCCLLAMWGNAM